MEAAPGMQDTAEHGVCGGIGVGRCAAGAWYWWGIMKPGCSDGALYAGRGGGGTINASPPSPVQSPPIATALISVIPPANGFVIPPEKQQKIMLGNNNLWQGARRCKWGLCKN